MLRDYQTKTLELCRKAFREGHRKILVALPTGSGKTEIFMSKVKSALAKHQRVLIIVRRKSIVLQTAARLKVRINCDAGVFMSRHTNNLDAPCVVSSIDTLSIRFKRNEVREWVNKFDMIIVDEAHDCTSESYQKVLDYFAELKKTVFGYTATPYRIGRKGHTWWDCCIKPITPAELRDQGYLSPITIYSPTNVNLSHIQIVGGEFHNKQLYQAVNQRKIYGNIIDTYKRIADGKSAIVFCVNKEHSRRVCEAFKAAGYDSEHCDCGTDMEERQRVIDFIDKSTRSDKPFILCNVNIFSTGIDIPAIEVLIQARPTASKVLYLQQVGRVLRPAEGKERAILIDHGANCMRFGSPYDDHEPELEDIERFKREPENKSVGHRCQSCGYYSGSRPSECPGCGTNHDANMIVPTETEDMVDVFTCDLTDRFRKELVFIKRALEQKGKPTDFAFYVLHKKHGEKVMSYLPGLNCPDPIRRDIKLKQLQIDRRAKHASRVRLYS